MVSPAVMSFFFFGVRGGGGRSLYPEFLFPRVVGASLWLKGAERMKNCEKGPVLQSRTAAAAAGQNHSSVRFWTSGFVE